VVCHNLLRDEFRQPPFADVEGPVVPAAAGKSERGGRVPAPVTFREKNSALEPSAEGGMLLLPIGVKDADVLRQLRNQAHRALGRALIHDQKVDFIIVLIQLSQ